MYDANAVIISHNHPGGSLSPIRADIEVTRAVIQAFASVGIKVVDHVIIADNKFYSFAENGRLESAMLTDRSVMEPSIKDRMLAAKEQASRQQSGVLEKTLEKATVMVK